jgi:hypothetical protein
MLINQANPTKIITPRITECRRNKKTEKKTLQLKRLPIYKEEKSSELRVEGKQTRRNKIKTNIILLTFTLNILIKYIYYYCYVLRYKYVWIIFI